MSLEQVFSNFLRPFFHKNVRVLTDFGEYKGVLIRYEIFSHNLILQVEKSFVILRDWNVIKEIFQP